MRLLFDLDKKDYDVSMPQFIRPSVRGIILRDGKVAMIHSLKYDYYKFPGGGIEGGEGHIQTLIREIREEAGLEVIPESIREYGWVHRAQKSGYGDVLVQENYYYLCQTEDLRLGQNLDDYEQEERFTLEFVEPRHAICVNRRAMETSLAGDPVYALMAEREARVLEWLLKEIDL